MVINALSNQSFYDISIQVTGTVDNAFIIAKKNQMSVSDKLIIGQKLVIPSILFIDSKIIQYYNARNIIPATALKKEVNKYGLPEGEFPFSL